MADVVAPGAPTVDIPGPALPADDTNMMLCLLTNSVAISHTRPASGRDVGSP
jgi:hypothetical protein